MRLTRRRQPDEVAAVAAFLPSKEPRSLIGETISVAGGRFALNDTALVKDLEIYFTAPPVIPAMKRSRNRL